MKKILMLSAALAAFSCVKAEEECSSGGVGFYLGGGVLACNSGERVDYQQYTVSDYDANGNWVADRVGELPRYTEANSLTTRLGGTLVLGVQTVINNFCIGLELGSDFLPRDHQQYSDKAAANSGDRFYDLTTTRNGIVPYAAFRLGYISHEYKTMVYVKAGMSHSKSREQYNEYGDTTGIPDPDTSGKLELKGLKPLVALGVEKSIMKDVTGRLEAEYRFGKKKHKTSRWNDQIWFYQRGAVSVRMLFTYNIRI